MVTRKISIDESILAMADSGREFKTVASFIDAVILSRKLKATKTNRIAYHRKYADLFRLGMITRQGGTVRLLLKGERLLDSMRSSDG